MNERNSKRIFICGAQGVGKTHISLMFAAATLSAGKRVLILCPDGDEQILKPFPIIKAEALSTFPKISRLIYDEDDPDFFEKVKDEKTGFKNGLVIVDDGQFFVVNQRNEIFNKYIMRARQKNIDVIFSCHGMSTIPRSFWSFFTDLILFYTSDGLNSARQNIPDFEEKREWKERINNTVMTTKNIRYCEHFKLQPSVYDFLQLNENNHHLLNEHHGIEKVSGNGN